MSSKTTGYGIFKSTGGNRCIQCGIRMRKGLPYMSPVRGKRIIREIKGKSICVSCIKELAEKVAVNLTAINDKELDLYEKRRFLSHLD
jgi:hypothetical protein